MPKKPTKAAAAAPQPDRDLEVLRSLVALLDESSVTSINEKGRRTVRDDLATTARPTRTRYDERAQAHQLILERSRCGSRDAVRGGPMPHRHSLCDLSRG